MGQAGRVGSKPWRRIMDQEENSAIKNAGNNFN